MNVMTKRYYHFLIIFILQIILHSKVESAKFPQFGILMGLNNSTVLLDNEKTPPYNTGLIIGVNTYLFEKQSISFNANFLYTVKGNMWYYENTDNRNDEINYFYYYEIPLVISYKVAKIKSSGISVFSGIGTCFLKNAKHKESYKKYYSIKKFLNSRDYILLCGLRVHGNGDFDSFDSEIRLTNGLTNAYKSPNPKDNRTFVISIILEYKFVK